MCLNARVSVAIYFFTHKQAFSRLLHLLDQIIRVKDIQNEIKSQNYFVNVKYYAFEKNHCSQFHFENKIWGF